MPARAGSDPLRSMLCFTLMAVWLTVAWAIVFVMKIGPEVAAIDPSGGHGVHSGDLLAIPAVWMGVLLYVKGCRAGSAGAPAVLRVERSRVELA